MLWLPKHIEFICEKLEEEGAAAYAVGGCVRDMLLGKKPHDFDVTTAALPEKIKAIFPHTVDTGIRHGTVTVVLAEENVEVTTFRQDGPYTDNRRPDSVVFVSAVEGDLARRDFTVNAMAYSARRGFCDPFAGSTDLANRLLRTVGEPERRFSEDALRILRLYRFSAQLGFSIETETEACARRLLPSLSHVSRERIFAELSKLLLHASEEDLQKAEAVFRAILPAVQITEAGIRKAAACKVPEGKWAHLCGTATGDALLALRAPRSLILSAAELAAYRKGENSIYDTAMLRYNTPQTLFAFLLDEKVEKTWAEAKKNGVPLQMSELRITGTELAEIGFRGKEIGETLRRLFVYAIENPVNNKNETLKEEAVWIYKQEHSQKA